MVAAGPQGGYNLGLLSTWKEAAGRMKNPGWEETGKPRLVLIDLGRLPGGRGLSLIMALGDFCSQARVPSGGNSVGVQESLF